MIIYTRINIFESNAQVLVNTVNTVGVMGKGLAKEFKRLYPDMFNQYQKYCENKKFSIGKLQIYKTVNKWILNFPTKENWRNPSKLDYIEEGLKKFVANYEKLSIKSISFPMLGCGNGGLDWESEVKPLMQKYLKNLPIDIFIHTASKDKFMPEYKDQKNIDIWLKSEPYYLSNLEFINHLKNRYSKLINTITNDELKLNIDVSFKKFEENDLVCLESKEIKLCLEEDSINNIWQILKNGGILTKDMLPFELAKNSNMIMLFLSKLEYVTLTQLDNENIAIRLLAYIQPKTKNLTKELLIA